MILNFLLFINYTCFNKTYTLNWKIFKFISKYDIKYKNNNKKWGKKKGEKTLLEKLIKREKLWEEEGKKNKRKKIWFRWENMKIWQVVEGKRREDQDPLLTH